MPDSRWLARARPLRSGGATDGLLEDCGSGCPKRTCAAGLTPGTSSLACVSRRAAALAGIAAPVCFVTAWAVAGARTPGYSPVEEHISELARVGAPTRLLMTSGMVGFGLLAPVWATSLPRKVATSVAAAGLATIGVAAAPLGAAGGDGPHAAAAGVAYLAMAATPVLGAELGSARASRAVGLLSAVLL